MIDEQDKKALDMVRAVYEDEAATINGRTYTLTKMVHQRRRAVFAFASKLGDDMRKGNFSWMDSPEFSNVERVINDHVLFDGQLISKLPKHWDEYPEDYIMFITTMLGAMSYPFMRAAAGG